MLWSSYLPGILIVLLALLVLAIDLFFNPKQKAEFPLLIAFSGLLAILLVQCFTLRSVQEVVQNANPLGSHGPILQIFFVLSALLTIWIAPLFFHPEYRNSPLSMPGEFIAILLFCCSGMTFAVVSQDLLTLVVSLELATIPLFVLVGFSRHSEKSGEAGVKYVLLGSLSTAFLIFGASLVFGRSGSLQFSEIAAWTSLHSHDSLFIIGAWMIISALGFKLAAAPFHMWAPDIYQGAPLPVVAFISVASKAAAFGVLLLLLLGPFSGIHVTLVPLLIGMACLSMLVGNLGALRQTSLGRFMAYSSIAQVGFLLLGLLGPKSDALFSCIQYLFIYAFGNFTAFMVFGLVAWKRPFELQSLRGLSRQSPALAFVLMLAMFSLAGIPPLAGFIGKFALLASAAKSGYIALVFFAAVNAVVSLYYYLIVIKEAYITEIPDDIEDLGPLHFPFSARWALILFSVGLLLLGIHPFFANWLTVF